MIDRWCLVFLLVLWVGCQSAQHAANGTAENKLAGEEDVLVLVVHEANSLGVLSHYELKTLYLGQNRFWPNGGEVSCIHFPRESEERESFSMAVFNQSAYQQQRYWIRVVERGYPAKPPLEIARASRILAFVHRHQNAIGYVRLSDFNYFRQTKQYKIKCLKFEDVQPSLEAARAGSYPLTVSHHIPLGK